MHLQIINKFLFFCPEGKKKVLFADREEEEEPLTLQRPVGKKINLVCRPFPHCEVQKEVKNLNGVVSRV